MNNVEVTKVKVVKAPETVKPDEKVEVQAPEVKVEAEKVSVLDKFEATLDRWMSKMAGTYDGKYQEEEKKAEEDGVQGVPGTTSEEEKKAEGDYDGGYAKHSEPDGDEPDKDEEPDGDEYEECVCDKCGSNYKMKKVKKAEEEEEEEEKRAEEVLPKKAELAPDLSADSWKKMFGNDVKPSKAMQSWQSACDEVLKKQSTLTKE
jgi:hypothetical protein